MGMGPGRAPPSLRRPSGVSPRPRAPAILLHTPGRIRTCDRSLRRRLLYPTELRALDDATSRRIRGPARCGTRVGLRAECSGPTGAEGPSRPRGTVSRRPAAGSVPRRRRDRHGRSPMPPGADVKRPAGGSVSYADGVQIAKVANSGSSSTAMRPTVGMSMGGAAMRPPSDTARSAVASQSST